MELEDFAIPHDPESVHQLHWTPGQFGKMLLENNGTWHTWPVHGGQDGTPFHIHYQQDNNLAARDISGVGWIMPDGKFLTARNVPHADKLKLMQLEPRVSPHSGDDFWGASDAWSFDSSTHIACGCDTPECGGSCADCWKHGMPCTTCLANGTYTEADIPEWAQEANKAFSAVKYSDPNATPQNESNGLSEGVESYTPPGEQSWTPGLWGKGFVRAHDSKPFIWGTSPQDEIDNPDDAAHYGYGGHHNEVATMMGLSLFAPNTAHTPVYVTPNGVVHKLNTWGDNFHYEPELFKQLGLTLADDEDADQWGFSPFARVADWDFEGNPQPVKKWVWNSKHRQGVHEDDVDADGQLYHFDLDTVNDNRLPDNHEQHYYCGVMNQDTGDVECWTTHRGIRPWDENILKWLKQYHPNPRYVDGYKEGWKVAKTSAIDRVLNFIPMTAHPGGPPVLYHPETKSLTQGPQGASHYEVWNHLGQPSDYENEGRLSNDGKSIFWYRYRPEHAEATIAAGLVPKGAPYNDDDWLNKYNEAMGPSPGDPWDFESKTAGAPLTRYLRLHDGTVLDEFNDTSHHDMMRARGLTPDDVASYGYAQRPMYEGDEPKVQWLGNDPWYKENWKPGQPQRNPDDIWQFANVASDEGDEIDTIKSSPYIHARLKVTQLDKYGYDYKVTEGQTTSDQSEYGELKAFMERRPYLVGNGKVFVGQPGTHHADVAREFDLGDPAQTGMSWGALNQEEHYGPAHRIPGVVQAINGHLGIDLPGQDQRNQSMAEQWANGWDFGPPMNKKRVSPLAKTAAFKLYPNGDIHGEPVLPWQPGGWGKALAHKDGRVKIWGSKGGRDGNPIHEQMWFNDGGYMSHEPFIISPDGKVRSHADNWGDENRKVEGAGEFIADQIGGTYEQDHNHDSYFDNWNFEGKVAAPQHQINHTVGEPGGRYVMLNDGSVHTWDWSTNQMHHSQYLQSLGLMDSRVIRTDYQNFPVKGMGWIASDGSIDATYPFEETGPEVAKLLGTKVYGDEDEHWNFGKVASMQVVEGTTSVDQSQHGDMSKRDPSTFMGRRPYFVCDNTVYLGQPGVHHADVGREFNLPPYGEWGEVYFNENNPYRTPTHRGAMATPEVVEAVNNHLGIDAKVQDLWSMGKVADMVNGDEDDWTDLIGQQLYDEWQFSDQAQDDPDSIYEFAREHGFEVRAAKDLTIHYTQDIGPPVGMHKLEWRTPVLYDEPNNALYVGKEGGHHWDINREFPQVGYRDYGTGNNRGVIYAGEINRQKDGKRWLGWMDRPNAHDQIRDALGLDPEPRLTDDGWTFGKTAVWWDLSGEQGVWHPVQILHDDQGEYKTEKGQPYSVWYGSVDDAHGYLPFGEEVVRDYMYKHPQHPKNADLFGEYMPGALEEWQKRLEKIKRYEEKQAAFNSPWSLDDNYKQMRGLQDYQQELTRMALDQVKQEGEYYSQPQTPDDQRRLKMIQTELALRSQRDRVGRYLTIDEARAAGEEYLAQHPEVQALADRYEAQRVLSNTSVFYHGTTEDKVPMIMREGLRGDNRHGVYLADTPETARQYGPVVIEVSVPAMVYQPNGTPAPPFFEDDWHRDSGMAGEAWEYDAPIAPSQCRYTPQSMSHSLPNSPRPSATQARTRKGIPPRIELMAALDDTVTDTNAYSHTIHSIDPHDNGMTQGIQIPAASIGESRPSFREFPIVGGIREPIQRSVGHAQSRYHNSDHNVLNSRAVSVEEDGQVHIGPPGSYHSDLPSQGKFQGRLYDDKVDWYQREVPEELHKHLEKAVGRSLPVVWRGDESWHFGKKESHTGVHLASPWKFRYLAGQPNGAVEESAKIPYEGDHSFIMNPETREVVMGTPDVHHHNLFEHVGGNWKNQGSWRPGAVFNGRFHGYVDPEHPAWNELYDTFNRGERELYGRDLERTGLDNPWHMGNRSPNGNPQAGTPKIITLPAGDDVGRGKVGDAVLYHRPTNTIAIGPNQHHMDVRRQTGWQKHEVDYGTLRPEGMIWYGQKPVNHEILGEALGVPTLNFFDHFGSVTNGNPQWETPSGYPEWKPGMWGRSVIDHEGDEHRWDINGPEHWQWTEDHPDLEATEFRYTNPEGLPQVFDRADPHGWQFEGSDEGTRQVPWDDVDLVPWTPGNSGKYMIWPHKVVTWDGNKSKKLWTSGAKPTFVHHQDMARTLDGQVPVGMGYIRPDGGVTVDETKKEYFPMLEAAGLKLTPFEWNFHGKRVASPPPWETEGWDDGYGYRPVLKLQNGHTVVGKPHEFHEDLLHQGLATQQDLETGEKGTMRPDGSIMWYNDPWRFEGNSSQVSNGGHGYRSEYTQDEHQITKPWTPGLYGKWVGYPDRTYKVWSADDSSTGEPHHEQVEPNWDNNPCGDIDANGVVNQHSAFTQEHAKELARLMGLKTRDDNGWSFTTATYGIQAVIVKDGRAYLGQPIHGRNHWHLAETFNLKPPYDGVGYYNGSNVYWFTGNTPKDMDAAKRAVEAEVGPVGMGSEEGWHFGGIGLGDLLYRLKPHTCPCGRGAVGEIVLTNGQHVPVCAQHRQPTPEVLKTLLLPGAQDRSMFRAKTADTEPTFQYHKYYAPKLDMGGPQHNGWGGRLPLLWDDVNNIVHVGMPDTTHFTLWDAAKTGKPWSDYASGWVGHNPEVWRGQMGGRTMGWYQGVPDHIHDAVQNHFNIEEEDPEKENMSGWNFGKVAQSPPEVVHIKHPPYDKEEDWKDRQAFIYSAPENKLYLGDPGTHHGHITMDPNFTSNRWGEGSLQGWIEGNMDWWNSGPNVSTWGGEQIPPHVVEALRQHVHPNIQIPEDAWHFGAVDPTSVFRLPPHPDAKPWVPGKPGKGFSIGDQIYGWTDHINQEHPALHHDEAIDALPEAVPGKVSTMFFIDEKGRLQSGYESRGESLAQVAKKHGLELGNPDDEWAFQVEPHFSALPSELDSWGDWYDYHAPEVVCPNCKGEGLVGDYNECPVCDAEGHLEHYYHVAPTADRARIKTHGLQPSWPGASGNWPDNNFVRSQPTGVYLNPSDSDAIGAREALMETRGDPMTYDIWRVNPLAVKNPMRDHKWPNSVYQEEPIHPRHLELALPAEEEIWREHPPRPWREGSAGVLKWVPGNTGKGFVAGGQLYTWNASGNKPHHAEMWDHFRKSDPNIPIMSGAFSISPTGETHVEYGDPADIMPYISQDPHLRPQGQEWHFGALPTEPPKVIDASLDDPRASAYWNSANFNEDPDAYSHVMWSGYYSPEHNTAWVGNGFTHHYDISERHAMPDDVFPFHIDPYHPQHTPETLREGVMNMLHEREKDPWRFGAREITAQPYDVHRGDTLEAGYSPGDNYSAPLWEPGHWGKGFVTQHGKVVHWRTKERADDMDDIGATPYHPSYYDGEQVSTAFYIRPNGEVRQAWMGNTNDDEYDLEQMLKSDHRLKRGSDGWDFESKVAHGPEVVELPPIDPRSEAPAHGTYDSDWLADRRPVIFDENNNKIWVGRGGWHHTGIVRHPDYTGSSWAATPHDHFGWIGDVDQQAGNELHFYGAPSEEKVNTVYEALKQRMPDLRLPSNNEVWDFGSSKTAARDRFDINWNEFNKFCAEAGVDPDEMAQHFLGTTQAEWPAYRKKMVDIQDNQSDTSLYGFNYDKDLHNRFLRFMEAPRLFARAPWMNHWDEHGPHYTRNGYGWGKGVIYPDGQIHTWNTGPRETWNGEDWEDGYPGHDEYRDEYGIEEKPQTVMWLTPEGKGYARKSWQAEQMHPDTERILQQAHPDIDWTVDRPDNWNFESKLATDRIGPLTMVPGGGGHGDSFRPVMYDIDAGKGYIGDPGAFHWDMIENNSELRATHPKRMGPPPLNNYYLHGRLNMDAHDAVPVHWYSGPYGDFTPDANQWLEHHLGKPVDDVTDGESDWNFSSKTAATVPPVPPNKPFLGGLRDYYEPYEPGKPGKGWLYPDGTMHAWRVYAPHETGGSYPGPYHNGAGLPPDRRPVWISEDGMVSSYGGGMLHGEEADMIPQLYPALKVQNRHSEPWDFDMEGGGRWGKTAENQEPQILTMPDTMREHYDSDVYDAMKNRRAFVYYPEHNTVYTGSPGAHHDDVIEHFKLPWVPGRLMGVRHDGPSFGFGGGQNAGIRFVGAPDKKHNWLLDHLSQKWKLPVLEYATDEWNF